MRSVLTGKANDWCEACDNPYYCCTCPKKNELPDNGDTLEDIEEGNPIDMDEIYKENN